MPRRDEGHEETERVLADLEKRITKEYAQAEKEIQAKLDDYMRRFATKDKIKHQAMLDGKITEAEYTKWRIGQMAMGQRWEEMKNSVAKDLTNASQIAKSVTNGYMPEVYAINHNYGTFQVEKISEMDTSYTMYDRDSAERMFKETDFYKKPGKKIQKAINEGKQMAWDKKQIQSVMFQGIVQGESIGQIATRIAEKTCDSDRKAAIRNARTITTGIENAGRVDSYKRAEDMGIKLSQQWVASLDFRTRHEHRILDGQTVPVGEKFEVEGYEIEYPGDPTAADEMVYNCRCTLIPCLEGFERDLSDTSIRHDSHLGDISYDEWKESKEEYSEPITKQDDIAQMMRESYIQDYRYLDGYNSTTTSYEGLQDFPPLKENSQLLDVNPSHSTKNCTSCTVAYEARSRGYDVCAKKEPVTELRNNPSKAWVDPDVQKVKGNDKFTKLDQAIYNMGEGTRVQIDYTTNIKLSDGTYLGHSIVGVVHGGVTYIDAQREGSLYHDNIKNAIDNASEIRYYRIDNLEISETGLKGLEKRGDVDVPK